MKIVSVVSPHCLINVSLHVLFSPTVGPPRVVSSVPFIVHYIQMTALALHPTTWHILNTLTTAILELL